MPRSSQIQLPKPAATPDFGDKWRRYSRERISHQYFPGGLEHEHMSLVHPAQRCTNIIQRCANQTCKRSKGWSLYWVPPICSLGNV